MLSSSTSNAKVVIGQLNMMRSKAVDGEYKNIVKERNMGLFCMTEPYSSNGKIGGTSVATRVVTRTDKDPQAAISFLANDIEVLKLSQYCDKHCVCAEVRSQVGKFYIVSTYFQYSDPIDIHISKLDRIVRKLRGNQIIITGDFNARSTVWHDRITDDNGKEVEDFVVRNNLYIINEENNPATYSHNGESNIDLTIATRGIMNKIRNWRVNTELSTSDHRTITFEIHSRDTMDLHSDQNQSRYALRKANWNTVIARVYERWMTFDNTPNMASAEDIDIFTDKMTHQLNEACKETIPKRGEQLRAKGWWTPELTLQRKSVARLRRTYQRESDPGQREIKRRVYNKARNDYHRGIETTRQSSFEKFVTEHGNTNPWGLVYRYKSNKLKPRQLLSSILTDGANGITTTWHETARAIMGTLLPDAESSDSAELLAIENDCTIDPDTRDDAEFNPFEVEKALMSLNKGKSPGLDLLEVEFLQKTWCVTWQSIIHILNSCLQLGVYPTSWKTGKVVIINKGSNRDPQDPNSYRPIMLLNVLGKLFEKLLVKRIMYGVESSGLFSNKQYGFRAKVSTEDALVDLVRAVKEAEDKYVMGIFLDIAGAFDNLWWPSVFKQLKRFNCPKNIYRVISSYFKDRKAVLQDQYDSVSKVITKGCPQGSILGPYIWNIVFNDSMNPDVKEFAFADDKVIIIHGTSRSDLERKGQIAIDFMLDWCRRNRMKLSAEKSVLLQLKGKFNHRRPPLIKVENKNLKMVTSTKYLGVDIDERLGVTSHVARVSEKAKTISHALRRVARERWGLKPKTLSVIYKGAVESILTFNAAGWAGRTNAHHMRSLEGAQRSAMLTLTKGYRTTPTSALQVISGVLPIDILLKERICKYDIRKGKTTTHGQVTLISNSMTKNPAYDLIREESLDLWQSKWNDNPTGRLTYEFLPDVRAIFKKKTAVSGPIVQILTGHGKTREYLKRFNFKDSNLCDCGAGVQDINHILYECELMEIYRQELISATQVSAQWPMAKSRLMDDDIFEMFKVFATRIVDELVTRISLDSGPS